MIEDLLESFENGSWISLQSEGGYISCSHDPIGHPEVSFVLRPHCSSWERFRLTKWPDNTISLQPEGGWFVSPVNDVEEVNWTTRKHACAWERLRFQVVSHHETSLIHEVYIFSVINGQSRYLSRKSSGAVITSSHPSTRWTIRLASVPCFNLIGLDIQCSERWSTFDARHAPPGDIQRSLVLKVLRSLQEVGAFYISGHGLSADLFQMCQSNYGHRGFRSLSDSNSDASFKLNHRLFDSREGYDPESLEMLGGGVVSTDLVMNMIRDYFQSAEQLSSNILHAMAAAQTFAQQPVDHACAATTACSAATCAGGGGGGGCAGVCYRGAWGDEFKYTGLRVLSYHPGPQYKPSGSAVVTTARHTDATWLTLLWNDDSGGLKVNSVLDRVLEPVQPVHGALLVNTGNVMKTASKGFFHAVCHWVERNDKSMTHTRISMPFFYDRFDDRGDGQPGFHGGGTGGC